MDNQKEELVKRLREASNILVTVSSNPSVDQLSALIGLTLLLNKLGKHATAVFSGDVPSTIEFLKPEETIEANTDSLRDFIISLDKSKADKLRYKVEDNVVKIFITPYKTSITDQDLDFSQGDFNVDVVLCLGVDKQQDLDQAITAHGRILHDATVAVVSLQQSTELGSLNWSNPQASSLSELAAELASSLDKKEIDGQIATALLTGIVAETDRFSNDKTNPAAMQLAAELMAAGANQQLVASQLASHDDSLLDTHPANDTATGDGTLEIGHHPDSEDSEPQASDSTPPSGAEQGSDAPEIAPGPEVSEVEAATDASEPAPADDTEPASRLILQPPSMGGTLTANSKPEGMDPAVDPLSMLDQSTSPLLSHTPSADEPAAAPPSDVQLPEVSDTTPATESPEVAEPQTPVLPEPTTESSQPTPFDTATDAPPALAEPEIEPPTMPEPPPAAVAEPFVPAPVDSLPGFEPLPSEPQTATPVPDTTLPPSPSPFSTPEVTSPTPPEVPPMPEPSVAEPTSADASLDAARDAVMDAINAAPTTGPLPPQASVGAEGYLNVQDLESRSDPVSAAEAVSATPDMPVSSGMPPVTPEPTPLLDAAPVAASPADTPLTMPVPSQGIVPPADPTPPTSVPTDPNAAPPVPPPLPFDDLSKFTNPPK